MDTVSAKKRSQIMAQVKSRNTSPEIAFRKILYKNGIRYRLHYKIDGNPDIVIVSKKIAIFIDGCFWHKCPRCYRPPHTNLHYWEPKIERNVLRDRANNKTLKLKGWHVIRFWEHQIKKTPQKALAKVLKLIRLEPAGQEKRGCQVVQESQNNQISLGKSSGNTISNSERGVRDD